MIGKKILHYHIIEKLGEGGMGIVYLADDSKLKRPVAIKFLPHHISANSDERKRFEIEAQAAAALNHPNISTIYSIEETDNELFIVMEYISGQHLKDYIRNQPPDVEETLAIAIQIADGLEAAHKKGIVHRDIKSANIMRTVDGKVKIMDFGLAKFRGSAQLTQIGTTLGTAAYMSPEQAKGEDVDQRSDIWSFGIVLYEMLTGTMPFKGDYEQAVVFNILNEAPVYPDNIRPHLKRILEKSLTKNPAQRYQSIHELLKDLKSNEAPAISVNVVAQNNSRLKVYVWSALILLIVIYILAFLMPSMKQEQTINSIAVLPFTDMSPTKDQEYFADGMAEEIINSLVQIKDLKVPARTSTFRYKGQNKDIKTIGKELDVAAVLEGSIRKSADKIRVTAQLIKADDGFHIWSNTYERKLTDIFEIQDELSASIVTALKIKISGDQKILSENKPINVDAYNLYLKGRFYWNKRSKDGLLQSIDYFNQAIKKDSSYGLAYTGLADAYNILGVWDYLAPNEVFPKAKFAALKALEIDESIAEAHSALAYVKSYYEWDWSGAEESFKRAIELKPNYAHAHHWYAELLSVPLKKPEQARIEIDKALELDPLSLIINAVSGFIYGASNKPTEAIKQLEKTLSLEKDFIPAHYFLLEIYAKKGFNNQTFLSFREAMSGFYQFDDLKKEKLNAIYQEDGWPGVGTFMIAEHEKLEKIGYASDIRKSLFYLLADDRENALHYLEKAYEIRNPFMVYFDNIPQATALRSEPRFQALGKKMGIYK